MKQSSSVNKLLTKATLEQLFDEKLAPIHKELKNHSNQFVEIRKELKNHGKQLRKLSKDQKAMLAFLDNEQAHQKKRLNRIEEKLDLPRIPYI